MVQQQQGFPGNNTNVLNSLGGFNQPWYQFFIALWNRTGGGSTQVNQPSPVEASTGEILLAMDLLSPIIIRSGPAAPFTDTTDTAVNYVGALNSPYLGEPEALRLINTTASTWTLAPGTGFIFMGNLTAGNFVIPANSSKTLSFYVTNILRPAVSVYG